VLSYALIVAVRRRESNRELQNDFRSLFPLDPDGPIQLPRQSVDQNQPETGRMFEINRIGNSDPVIFDSHPDQRALECG